MEKEVKHYEIPECEEIILWMERCIMSETGEESGTGDDLGGGEG